MSNREMQNELLDAYMVVTYSADKTTWPAFAPLGYYYVPIKVGTGATPVEENWVKYDIIPRFQDGTITPSLATLGSTAKQLGTFYDTVHYVPTYTMLYKDNTYIPSGIQDAMRTVMKEGDSIRLVLVSDLAGSYRSGDWTPAIIDVILRKVIPDPVKFEQNEVVVFRNTYYPGLDTLKANIYLKQLVPPTGTEGLVKDDTAKFFYVARYLDGFVFDTNVLDTAKKYKFSTKTASKFDTLNFVLGATAPINSLSTTKIPSLAFNEVLKNVKDGERIVTFFTSEYGYGATGNTPIQSYTPLQFEIWMTGVGKKKSE